MRKPLSRSKLLIYASSEPREGPHLDDTKSCRFALVLWRLYYAYVGPAMQRTTLMLPRDLKERAAREARARGVSLGELIREALTALLRRDPGSSTEDPLIADRAVYDGPIPSDTSERHDDLLYGPAKGR